MIRITEAEFARICNGIRKDSESICKHNPLGNRDEILLWMLMSCLISYLSLTEVETPCFSGVPTSDTYRKAIIFVLQNRKIDEFDVEKYLDDLILKVQ
jgi:hypothetical protein